MEINLFDAMALVDMLLISPASVYTARHFFSLPLKHCSSPTFRPRPLGFLPVSSSPHLKSGSRSRRLTCSSNLAMSVPDTVESPTMDAKKALQLEDLQWRSTFVDELPGDPQKGGPVRQVTLPSRPIAHVLSSYDHDCAVHLLLPLYKHKQNTCRFALGVTRLRLCTKHATFLSPQCAAEIDLSSLFS